MGKFSLTSGKLLNDVSKIEHTVRCTLCGEILTCSSENTAPLVDHLRKNHPNVQVARFPELKPGTIKREQGDENKNNEKKHKDTTEYKTQSVNKDELAKGDQKCKKETMTEKKNKKLYETTVEVWQRSQGPVFCETCGECQTPIIRVRKKCHSESSATAMCLLGCWPLCFLPYMMSGGNSENLTDSYCSKCGHTIKAKKLNV